MGFGLSVVGLSLDNIFDCIWVWSFSDGDYHLSIFSRLIMLVVVSIYKIIVSLELVLLKIWSELVASTWRVMGGAILQLLCCLYFWLHCAVELSLGICWCYSLIPPFWILYNKVIYLCYVAEDVWYYRLILLKIL